LRFVSNDCVLLAASAGSPFVNVYHAPDADWRGVRSPVRTIRVLSNEDYLRCRITREDGGPKGIDVNNTMDVVVVTCENKPLVFYDLNAILNDARVQGGLASPGPTQENASGPNSERRLGVRKGLEITYQLWVGKITAALTSAIRWTLRTIPVLSWLLNTGRKVWNPQLLTKPF
jgi:hypothetical protein